MRGTVLYILNKYFCQRDAKIKEVIFIIPKISYVTLVEEPVVHSIMETIELRRLLKLLLNTSLELHQIPNFLLLVSEYRDKFRILKHLVKLQTHFLASLLHFFRQMFGDMSGEQFHYDIWYHQQGLLHDKTQTCLQITVGHP